MIRPANFAFNEQTAANNAFQQNTGDLSAEAISQAAKKEFNAFVKKLREAGVNVLVAEDTKSPAKPDAVFPNNWVSFHQEGFVITYPMFSPLRRFERRRKVIEQVIESGFASNKRVNFEYNEKLNYFLEGTGSIIFDHPNRIAYACLSQRTDERLLGELCELLGYTKMSFHSVDAKGQAVYHTNVMMALGETFVVICLESVPDAAEREILEKKFAETKKEIVAISLDQMNQFAGNMLQVRNEEGMTILVMSETAYKSLETVQITTLKKHTQLLHASIGTIEKYGGGSARCMMAEIFLPKS